MSTISRQQLRGAIFNIYKFDNMQERIRKCIIHHRNNKKKKVSNGEDIEKPKHFCHC
jgi:hypothetical protein